MTPFIPSVQLKSQFHDPGGRTRPLLIVAKYDACVDKCMSFIKMVNLNLPKAFSSLVGFDDHFGVVYPEGMVKILVMSVYFVHFGGICEEKHC